MKSNLSFVFMTFVAVCNSAYADVEVKSQNGNSAVFSQPKHGYNIESDAWSKLIFNQNGKKSILVVLIDSIQKMALVNCHLAATILLLIVSLGIILILVTA